MKSGLIPILLSSLLAFPALAEEPAAAGDPLESFNRKVHNFNEVADRWVMKPAARTYVKITPEPVEQGVSNFFGNLLEIRNVFNDVLQGKWAQAGNDAGRFLVNSTLGIAGIFDVARHIDLEKSEGEDFGQTLAVWGVDSGPFLVLPFLGPSTLRDMGGLPVDWQLNPITEVDHVPTRNTLTAIDFVHVRAELLEAENFISGDRYVFIREAYLQRRNYLIKDGEVADDFGDFGDDYDSGYEDEGDAF